MQNWKMTLSYDGTRLHGWQVQPGLMTVQGTLAGALQRITSETVLPQGSGRTDAGVHALGQVASFALACPIPRESLHRALNRALPANVRVLAVEAVPPEFHARHSAVGKTYEYRIFPAARGRGEAAAVCSPFVAPYVWACPLGLDVERMNRAAALVVGTHDFTSFAAVDPDRTSRAVEGGVSNVRTISHACWRAVEGLLVFRVSGNGFLHHMVRNLVGTLVEIGAGRLAVEEVAGILAARDRSAAGPTAPAQGLFLVEVAY